MSETRRKLTTIFSADVQGYSRLMEADEEGTLATLRQYRDAMARLIAAHGGRVVNTWGDGLIADFPSVVEAVRAAVDVQNELAGHNAGRPTDTRMLFRIGINLGDVIEEGDDIYGDGVNVAARLQSSAPPGGIVISRTVHDQVRNKVAVGFDFLGNLAVKNMEEEVPSYAVRIGGGEYHDKRNGQPAIPPDATTAAAPLFGRAGAIREWRIGRTLFTLALLALGLVAINLLSWGGEFWAAWPLLSFATLAGILWVRTQRAVDRRLATFGVIGLGITAINLLTWEGEFWARWPLLGLAIAAGVNWIMRRGGGFRR
jgi:adenylate cyclase